MNKSTGNAQGPPDELPLSLGQRRLWTLRELNPQDPSYQHLAAVRLIGGVDEKLLEAALKDSVRLHDSLRTRFPQRPSGPVAVVEDTASVALGRHDLSSLGASSQHHALTRLARGSARRPFDLERGPLLRADLLILSARESVLMLCLHHMVMDGWSLGILLEDIASHYREHSGAAGPTHARASMQPACSFHSYVRESLLATQSATYQSSMLYWKQQLAELCWTRLPPDRAKPNNAKPRGRTVKRRFEGTHIGLDSRARSLCVTRYQLLLSAFTLWLGHNAGTRDVAFVTLLANRTKREHERMVGYLANTVVVRQTVDPVASLEQFILAVADSARNMLRHSAVSLLSLAEQGLEALRSAPSVAFALQNNPLPALQLGDIALETLDIDTGIAKFDLSVYLHEREGGLDAWVEYDTGLYESARIEAFVSGFGKVIDAFCASDPAAPARRCVQRFSTPSLLRGQGPVRDGAPPTLLAHAMALRAAETPHGVALEADGDEITFAALWADVLRARSALRRLGVRPGDVVAILGDRSRATLCAIWACLAEGLTYLPLSRELPSAKLRLMLDDARPGWRVCGAKFQPEAAAGGGTWQLAEVLIAGRGAEQAACGGLGADTLQALPAYLIYTSGSTGRPKGVLVSQRSVAAFSDAMDRVIQPPLPGQAWLAVSSLSFDIALLELLWAMSRGFRVIVRTLAELFATSAAELAERTAPTQTHGPSPSLGIAYFGSTEQYTPEAHLDLLRRTAQWADRQGFASLWAPERHFSAFGGFFSNPNLTSAYLAALTRRIALRAGSVIGPLHHTARLAEDWAMLDRLSDGRAGLSLAAGWNPADFVLSAWPIAERRDVVEQQVEDLSALWSGQAVAFPDAQGRYFDLQVPFPSERRIPLTMTVSNRVDQFVWAAKNRMGVLTHLLEQDIDQLARNIEAYRNEWQLRHGGSDQAPHVVLMVHTFISSTDEEARAAVHGHLQRYLETAVAALQSLLGLAGQGMQGAVPSMLLEMAADKLIRNRSLICSGPTAADRLQRLYRIGVDEVACLIDFGPDTETVMASLERLSAVRGHAQLPDEPETHAAGPAHAVTHFQCTPSAARLLLQQEELPPLLKHLRCWALGGEALDSGLMLKLRALSSADFLNLYGPTEATIWCSQQSIRARRSGPISIGQPFYGVSIYLLDDMLEPVPHGVDGQIFIAGEGIATGYWRASAATSSAFLPDPFGEPGSRMYATGDWARVSFSGTIEFVGRNDGQVKLNGHRVELDGFRHVIASHEGVAEAAVMALPPEIVAFVVAKPGRADGLKAELRAHLADHWEVGSLPSDILLVPELPLTPNQKTDVRQLESFYLAHRARLSESAEAPPKLDDELTVLHGMWASFLPRTEGSRSDFHQLGGNSLMATQLIARANQHFGVQVSLLDFYRDPTLHGHMRAIAAASENGPACPLLPVDRTRPSHPVSYSQRAMLIVAAMEASSEAYHDHIALRVQGELSVPHLQHAWLALNQRHQVLTTAYRFQDGDYRQSWCPGAQAPLRQVDAADRDGDVESTLLAFIEEPFDLETGQVARGMVLHRAADLHEVCVVLHHVVSDGATIRLLLQEWLGHYRRLVAGGTPDATPARWQYIDFADWQGRHLERHGPRLKAFWADRCAAMAGHFLALAQRRPGTAGGGRKAGHRHVAIEEEVVAALDALAARHRTGLLATLLLPLCLSLEPLDQPPGIVVLATDARHRPMAEFEEIPGMMVNQMLLPLQVPAEGGVPEALRGIHEQLAALFSHQALPYEWLVSLARAAGAPPGAPLFDIKVVLNEDAVQTPSVDALHITEHRLAPQAAKFGLLVNLQRDERRRLTGEIVFDRTQYREEQVEALWRTWFELLQRLPTLEDLHQARGILSELRTGARTQWLQDRQLQVSKAARIGVRQTVVDHSDD